MKIYTKKGDRGKSSIGDGFELPKSSSLFHLLGTLDELNASLGALHTSRNKKIENIVLKIQEDLLKIGAFLVGRNDSFEIEKNISWLEETIDKLEESNPPLKNFILPGGSRNSASLQLSRAICRRLERVFVEFYYSEQGKDSQKKNNQLLTYFNRLSDLLFVMARYVNFKLGVKETLFKNTS